MGYEEKRAAKRAERKAVHEKKWEAEYDADVGALDDGEHVIVQIESLPDLVGHVVCSLPTPAQSARYRAILYRDANQRGQSEARAKNGPELVLNCLVWPTREKYDALIAKHAFVPDMVATRCLEAARGRVEAEEKD